jgi:hypothetical protein
MPLVKIAASFLVAVLAAYLVGFETMYLGSRALDRACKTPSESCALSSPFVVFFGFVTGLETFAGVLFAGSLRLTNRAAAAWVVVAALAVVLAVEHAWLLS